MYLLNDFIIMSGLFSVTVVAAVAKLTDTLLSLIMRVKKQDKKNGEDKIQYL
jgi:aspartokinase